MRLKTNIYFIVISIMASGKKNNTVSLSDMLKKHIIPKENPEKLKITHTSLGNPKGSYHIVGEKYGTFMDLYCKAIDSGTELYLTEVHLEFSSILIDIDIKYSLRSKNNDHRYTHSIIEKIIKIYNKYIELFFDIEPDDYKAYLLEKDTPTLILSDDENEVYKYKDGVHIIFPFIWTKSNVQYIIREYVINELKSDNEIIKMLNDQNLYEVIDEAVIERNNWLMYGSAKPEYEKNKYKLTRIYDKNLSFRSYEELDKIEILELPKLLSIRQIKDDDEKAKFNENYSFDKITELHCRMFPGKKKTNMDDIRKVKKLCDMLSKKRICDYEKWISLGWCLHNIHDGLLHVWVELSSHDTSKFKAGECEKKWKNFRKDGYNIGSLYRWAKEDNPELYAEFILEENSEILKRSLSCNDYDVAKAFHEIFKDDYKCSCTKNKIWYEFKNNRWTPIDGSNALFNKLNEDMVHKYANMAQAYSVKMLNANNEDKEMYGNYMDQALKLSRKLRTVSFKKHLIEELTHLYHDGDFANKLDEDRDLLCFLNGVYDLKNNIFREGRPEDCISLCTGINYIPFDANDKNVKKVLQFFSEIQPEKDMMNYILDLMASCLQGHTPDEKFHIWTGTGGNGKSLAINLFQLSLGDYACTLPITILTSKRPSATTANPEIAKTKGKRFCVFQEPEHDDKIHVGYMKEISGGDKISARSLFKEPIEFIPQFKLILTCNNLPDIPSNDGGTWRRLRVVEFAMMFVDNPDPNNPKQKKKNPHFKNEFNELKEAFMSALINRFENYKINGLIEPSKVTEYTQSYQRNSDKYLDFIVDSLVKTNENSDKISIKNLFGYFKLWHKEFYNNATIINQKDFRINILNRLPKNYNTSGIFGYKYKDNDDSVEDQLNMSIEVHNDLEFNEITITQNNKQIKTNKPKIDLGLDM